MTVRLKITVSPTNCYSLLIFAAGRGGGIVSVPAAFTSTTYYGLLLLASGTGLLDRSVLDVRTAGRVTVSSEIFSSSTMKD
jgi:hypothetical protein